MEQKQRLIKTMTSMIGHYQKGDEKACYREYFALEKNDRQLVEASFRLARKEYPTPGSRNDAKGIYNLIRKNFKKEVTLMTDTMELMLRHWFFSSKEIFYDQFRALGNFEQEAILAALKEVIAYSDNEEFRQAAIDIPAFIQSKKLSFDKVWTTFEKKREDYLAMRRVSHWSNIWVKLKKTFK